jgi:hypothetical protein
MAEHLTVDQVVEGSSPFWHPFNWLFPFHLSRIFVYGAFDFKN